MVNNSVQYANTHYEAKEPVLCVVDVNDKKLRFQVKQAPYHTVNPLCASRELIIKYLTNMLRMKECSKGIEFVESLFYNFNKAKGSHSCCCDVFGMVFISSGFQFLQYSSSLGIF